MLFCTGLCHSLNSHFGSSLFSQVVRSARAPFLLRLLLCFSAPSLSLSSLTSPRDSHVRLFFFCGLWWTARACAARRTSGTFLTVVEEESGDCFQHVGTERVSLRLRSLWEKAAVDGSLQYDFHFVYDWVSVVYSFLFAPTFNFAFSFICRSSVCFSLLC